MADSNSNADPEAIERLIEWIRIQSRQRSPKRDGVLTFGPGQRDLDQPFDDFIAGFVIWIDQMLAERNAKPASTGRWAEVKAKAPQPASDTPSEIYMLANLSGHAQRLLAETDPNRRLHRAFNLGWEVALEKAGRTLGHNVRRGKKNAIVTAAGGRRHRKCDPKKLVALARDFRKERPTATQATIARAAAKKFDISPKHAEAILRTHKSDWN